MSAVSIPYENLAELANAKGLDPTIIRDVREGLAFLDSSGRKGEPAPQDIMAGVMVAANVIALDQSQLGTTAWCKARTPSLLQDGFIIIVKSPVPKDQ